jgi:hypothetical protein
MFAVVSLLAVSLVACGEDAGATSTTRLPAADIVVRQWTEAVAGGDAGTLRRLVAPESLAFVIGVESRLGPSEITALVDEGLSDELIASYWRSFAESFAAIDQSAIDRLAVGGTREFAAAGARYSAVRLGDDGRSVELFVRRSLEGRWELDVLATVGPGMVLQLVDLAAHATDDRFRTLIEQWVLPALEAAAVADPGGATAGAARDVRIALDSAG